MLFTDISDKPQTKQVLNALARRNIRFSGNYGRVYLRLRCKSSAGMECLGLCSNAAFFFGANMPYFFADVVSAFHSRFAYLTIFAKQHFSPHGIKNPSTKLKSFR